MTQRTSSASISRCPGPDDSSRGSPPSETSPGGRTNFRGGDWSSYWYNGLIYESDARRGLYVWKVSAPEVRAPMVHLDF